MQEGQYESSVPVIADRALQALAVNALEPEWEARFEPRSYGFRPGRGCHDAIEAIFNTVRGKNPQRRWYLTRTWQRRSTASIMTISSASSAPAAGKPRVVCEQLRDRAALRCGERAQAGQAHLHPAAYAQPERHRRRGADQVLPEKTCTSSLVPLP